MNTINEIKAEICWRGFRIPCPDEADFYELAHRNGARVDNCTTADKWRGLFVELPNGYIIYFYGEAYAYIVTN